MDRTRQRTSVAVIIAVVLLTALACGELDGPVGIAIVADTLVVLRQQHAPQDCARRPSAARAASSMLNCLNRTAFGADGNFYVSNFFDSRILRVTRSGIVSSFATLSGNNNGHVVAHGDELWVAARAAHQIARVSLDGTIEEIVGSGSRGARDGSPDRATLSLTNDLAFSPDGGTLYFTDVARAGPDTQTLAPTLIRKLVLF